MPVLTLESPAPLVAIVHVEGQTVRDVGVTDLGDGLVAVDLGGVEVGARIIGRADVLHHLIVEAENAIARLRGAR